MDSIDKLVNIFRKFPTVGSRTAGRLCELCFNPFDGENILCPICQNSSRNKNLLCIVEKETDLLSIESTKKFNGLYFILGGTVATMRKEDMSQLRIEELKKRLAGGIFSEIIVALNPTPEGRATSVLVERTIKEVIPSASPRQGGSPSFKITHLARGIPVGGELEYTDEETLESALEGRK
jgi:recombination protein RecR